MRCSFEETVEILMDAACFSTADNLRGVSENVMLGQLCPLGTGSFKLVLNEEMLREAIPNPDDNAGDELHSDEENGGQSPMASTPGQQSPWAVGASPFDDNIGDGFSPVEGNGFSPVAAGFSPVIGGGGMSPFGSDSLSPTSPAYSPTSPGHDATSPSYSPTR
jgi:DNA-directed RNA polymerase II subunit RPB1